MESSNPYEPPLPGSRSSAEQHDISSVGRWLVLIVVFLGWGFAGVQLSITSLAMRPAAIDLLGRVGTIDLERFDAFNRIVADSGKELLPADSQQLTDWNAAAQQWFAWYQCALLFGAATGGLVLGRFGDRVGRKKAMAASIFCYSLFSGISYFAESPTQLVLLRFLTCMGVGGMWPNGVALVSEVWSNVSRPMVAGVIGTSANVGIFLFATAATYYKITPDDWRWVMLVGASPVILGLFSLVAVPESPRWLATRDGGRGLGDGNPDGTAPSPTSVTEVFRPPYLSVTFLGIALATIPLFGGWGSANWMIPWADEAGEQANPPDPHLKARVGQARSFTGTIGSLLGGWIASYFGRRRSYFVVSLTALVIAQYAFWFTVPTDGSFLWLVAALGFFSGIYFGWLPLFLPELFPTKARSTGAGVSFNFGRILTAMTLFATGALKNFFAGDYAAIGRVTSLIFAAGMVVIFFAPDTSQKQLDD